MILNNVFYKDGSNAQDIHNEVGKAYNLPIISIKNSLYSEIEEGKVTISSITLDNLHRNDLGHSMIADFVTYYLDEIYNLIFGVCRI
jgi:acyl-CoA thioesterase I